MHRSRLTIKIAIWLLMLHAGVSNWCIAQSDFSGKPIQYSESPSSDPIAQLGKRLRSGEVRLRWDDRHGWLQSILEHLDIPAQSQTLVFSKTSGQFRFISPSNPRAIYFNEHSYVGVIPGAADLELAGVDNDLGPVFYTLRQQPSDNPQLMRDRGGECLACHQNGKTRDVPGLLVRSVYPRQTGHPELRLGSLATDHTTPFVDRFGGWYVTGRHGSARHRGNTVLADRDATQLDVERGANWDSVPASILRDLYLESTSDIVALMLLEHQTQFHNCVTKAAFETRTALHQQQSMNQILQRPADFQSDSTKRRIASVAESLVQYLFMCEEPAMPATIRGRSDFAKQFTQNGLRDANGRSLRDLNLENRLLEHSCSYMIYSEPFLSLPPTVKESVRNRMLEVLTNTGPPKPAYQHLSSSQRNRIRQILQQTHPWFQPPRND